ncbi:hypothetical protein GGI35DRAFT_85206 [Trichoderma velutinum]
MQFRCLTLITVLLSINQIQATTTKILPRDGINGIKNITELSSNLMDLVGRLNGAPSDPQTIDDYNIIVDDLNDIVADINYEVAALDDEPNASSDQQDLCDSFSGFVNVTQELFGVFSDKEPLLSEVKSNTEDFSAFLRALAFRVFELGSKIIVLAPSCADGSEKQLEDFVGTANQTIASFQLGG